MKATALPCLAGAAALLLLFLLGAAGAAAALAQRAPASSEPRANSSRAPAGANGAPARQSAGDAMAGEAGVNPLTGNKRQSAGEQLSGLVTNYRVILMVAGGLLVYLLFFKSPAKELHKATGRVSTPEEQMKAFGTEWGQGGFMLGIQVNEDFTEIPGAQVLRADMEQRSMHTLIQASPGQGKTTGYIVSQGVEDAVSGIWNIYAVDRKSPELYFFLAEVWRRYGHKAILLDPWTPELSWCFEPLWGATDEQIEAIVEAHVHVSNDPDSTLRHFRELERRILRTVFHCAQEWGKCTEHVLRCEAHRDGCQEHECDYGDCPGGCPARPDGCADCGTRACDCRRHMCTLPAVAELIARGWRATRAAIERARPDLNVYLLDLWDIQASKLNEMFAGLAGRLELYRDPKAAAVFSRSDFTIQDVVVPVEDTRKSRQRTMLVVGAPQSKGQNANLVAGLMTQLLAKAIYERRDYMVVRGMSWKECVPVSVVLDEYGTYGVQDSENLVATARSGGAGVTAIVQIETQTEKFYGRNAAEIMSATFGTHIYLRKCAPRVTKALSIRCGTKLVEDVSFSKGAGATGMGRTSSSTEGRRMIEVPLYTPDAIENMPKERALVLGDVHPTPVKLVQWFKVDKLRPAVEMSMGATQDRYNVNARCDEEGLRRPAGEVARPRRPVFDWAPIIGEAMERESYAPRAGAGAPRPQSAGGAAAAAGARPSEMRRPAGELGDQPVTEKQKNIIRGKCRDLKIHVQSITLEMYDKGLEDLTRAQASKVIDELERKEAEAKMDGGGQAGSVSEALGRREEKAAGA